MRNKGLIITLIILLSIIIFFLIILLVGCLKGGINFKNGFISIGSKSTDVVFDKQFELKDIKNIEIKQNSGDITFKETTNNYVQVVIYGENKDDVQVNLSNGKLDINYTNKKNYAFFNFGGIKNDIIVYVPSNYSNEIAIKNDYGNCKITDLEKATVNIDCDAGDVELEKVNNATIKCDYGNIEIKEIMNKCNIKANCGNIKIGSMLIKENSTIKADLGNVNIDNTNDIYIDVDVDLGNTNINKNNRNSDVTLKINCNCGNVIINN